MQSDEGRVFRTKRRVNTKSLKGMNLLCPRRKTEGILKVL